MVNFSNSLMFNVTKDFYQQCCEKKPTAVERNKGPMIDKYYWQMIFMNQKCLRIFSI